jgi:hypothetical protein
MDSVRMNTTSTSHRFVTAPSVKMGQEISRLITAAVVNKNFCNLLLSNPAEAIASGYNGESFILASDEQELIFSIHAVSLADFAMQLAKYQNTKKTNGNGNPNWTNRQIYQRA